MTIGWDQLVTVTTKRPVFRVFDLRVLNFNIGVKPSKDATDYVTGIEDRTGKDFWHEDGRNCFWELELLYTQDYTEFEESFKIYSSGQDPWGRKADIHDFLDLLEVDIDKSFKRYSFQRPLEFSMESVWHPRISGCLPDDVKIVDCNFFENSKIVRIFGRAYVGNLTVAPDGSEIKPFSKVKKEQELKNAGTKVYEFVIAPPGGCEELYGENLYIVVDSDDQLRVKFDKWAEEHYDPKGEYGAMEPPLPLEKIWSSRILCSQDSGDGVFTRESVTYRKLE